MKIVDVRVKLLSAPYHGEHSWNTGLGQGQKRDMILVSVETDDGLVGVGEAYHQFVDPRAVEGLIEHCLKPLVIGEDPVNIEVLWHKMFVSTLGLGSAVVGAISGVEIALWDVFARSTGLSVSRLLGGGGVDGVPAYVGCHTLGIQPPESLAEEAKSYVSDGYRALKVRGGAGIDADVTAVQAVKEAVGDDVDILIDANSAYSWPEAVRLGKALDALGIYWLESPFDYTQQYHQDELARLRSLGDAPIASGGSLFTRFQYRNLILHGGVDYITPDAVKVGGISETLKIAHIASAFGQLVGLHTVVGLGQFANVHTAAAIPQHVLSYTEWDPSPNNPLRDEIFTDPLRVERGFIQVPQGPGLGTDIIWDAVEEYPYIEGGEIAFTPRVRIPFD